MDLEFTNGFYQSPALPLSAQRCVNWYKNVSEVGSLSKASLFGTPGLSLVDAGQPLEPNRGAHVMAGVPYFVNGNNLYSLTRSVAGDGTETLTVNSLGTITGSGRVSMADNGTQLCIVVPNGDAYIYNGSLQTISDPDFDGPADTVCFIDGYFVFNKTGSSKIFHSELRDGLNYNALDFAEAEADPDQVVSVHARNGILYALGTKTIQAFANTGGTAFAFSPIPGSTINKGLRAKFAIHDFGNTVAFVGGGENEGESVWALSGSSVVKLSTTPLDALLQDATPEELDNAFALSHSLNGADFWCLTFGSRTVAYDQTASSLSGRKEWHERSSRISDEDVQWRVSSIVAAYNRAFAGDSVDGRIGQISDSVFNEYGTNIIRMTTTQPFENDGHSLSVSRLESTMNAGTGTATLDPQIGMDYSDDGGRTWSDILYRSVGLLGEYSRRAIWRRLGRFGKSRVLRFHFSEDSDPTFIKLEAEAR